jgi:DNA-binding transcriptional regulator YiaG
MCNQEKINMEFNFKTVDQLEEEWLKDPEYRKEYEKNFQYYEIAKIIVTLRSKANLSQKELAKKIGTSQSRLSSWENGNTKGIKFDTLLKILKATNFKLILNFEKINQENDDKSFLIAS